MCQYGNCHEEESLPVLVSTGGRAVNERKRFCSEYHAALWLLRWAVLREHNPNRKASANTLLDAAYKE